LPVFLGDDLLTWLLLAFGGALAVGFALALVRPPDSRTERPPLARSIVMILVGATAAIWALASLVSS
jgi:RsiW-degrading membrane proteinase PrsW (M82 family)